MNLKKLIFTCLLFISVQNIVFAQMKGVSSVSASTNANRGTATLDNNPQTAWELSSNDLRNDQYLMYTLQTPGDLTEISLETTGISKNEIREFVHIYITYDPMNPGEAVRYSVNGNQKFNLTFPGKYGAHVKILFKGNTIRKNVTINEIGFVYAQTDKMQNTAIEDRPWMNPLMPLEKRVESILSAMTVDEKMELLREGWGIPGIPRLGIPDIKKVEAIHGFSYGSGATIFPQSIGLGASWNKSLIEKTAEAIGDETLAAHAIQAWSPVLDVAQDARWGRCEETYGEDPVLVSKMGGAWIKGYQSKGLLTTPKHFAIHGAPLGGRDSHDIGLSEREIREIHLVPFRDVIKKYNCQSIMMAYSDYLGVPVAKSKELLHGILREEWGFDGFIVSDCGAIGNLTARKHYTAIDFVAAANQALAAGIATNCGDTYKNKDVLAAARNGQIDLKNLDNVCRTLLRTMFRNGLFENNPSKPLDWNKVYPGWNTPEHQAIAKEAALQSIVLLKNKDNILPLSKSTKTIAVIGPGADDLQTGDYTQKIKPGQLKSVLDGITSIVGKNTKVLYEKGCSFIDTTGYNRDEQPGRYPIKKI